MFVVYATVTTSVLVNNEGNIAGWIVGVTVPTLLLAVSVIIILILVMYKKRANINQKRYINAHIHYLKFVVHRKSDNDIVMECSPAYATTQFKTKLVTLLTITLCLYTHTVLLIMYQ